jgi:hypothetical protein
MHLLHNGQSGLGWALQGGGKQIRFCLPLLSHGRLSALMTNTAFLIPVIGHNLSTLIHKPTLLRQALKRLSQDAFRHIISEQPIPHTCRERRLPYDFERIASSLANNDRSVNVW